ncbi:MAG: hypothetical protein AAFP90_16700 [Planctomycetota bacterium]
MTAPDVTLANRIVADLGTPIVPTDSGPQTLRDAAKLDHDPTIQRRYLPSYDITDLQAVKIAVAPRLQTRRGAERARNTAREHTIQVAPHWAAAHKPDGQIIDARVDTFLELMEAIHDAITYTIRIADGATFTWIATSTDPLYDPQLLQSPGVLRGVITATYKRIT